MDQGFELGKESLTRRLAVAGQAFVDRLVEATKWHGVSSDCALVVLDRQTASSDFVGYNLGAGLRPMALCVVLDTDHARLVVLDQAKLDAHRERLSAEPYDAHAARLRVDALVVAQGEVIACAADLDALFDEHQLHVAGQLIAAAREVVEQTSAFAAARVSADGVLLDVADVRLKIGELHARLSALDAAFQEASASDAVVARQAVGVLTACSLSWVKALADTCVQLQGGWGYITRNPIAQFYCEINLVHRVMAPVATARLARVATRAGSCAPVADENFKQTFSDFLDTLEPTLGGWWAEDGISRDVFATFGRRGYLGLAAPTGYGGQEDAGFARNVELTEAMVERDLFALTVSTMLVGNTVVPILGRYASVRLRELYLRAVVDGTVIPCLAVSEAGSSSAMGLTLSTTAEDCGDFWKLDGAKCYITNAPVADLALVLARASRGGVSLGLSLFCVPMRSPSVLIAEKYRKLGVHGSETGRIVFEDCRIPKDHLVGEVGAGQVYVLAAISPERLMVAVAALTLALRCLDRAVAEAREPFAVRLLQEQRAQALVLKSRCRRAVADTLARKVTSTDAAMLKYVCGDFAKATVELCEKALSHDVAVGANDDWIERARRDARVMSLFAGASEIMREQYSRRIVAGVRQRVRQGERHYSNLN